MQPTIPEPVFLNVEYLFFLIYRAVDAIFSITFLETLRVIAAILIILLIAGIFYLLIRLYELKQEESKAKKTALIYVPTSVTQTTEVKDESKTGIPKPKRNETWESIRNKLLSENHSDWRLAIIEADIYMDKVLDSKGFHGETTADKLKQVTTGDLASINIAWEAHKVRNRIAHEGAAFTLTQPEARRILSYFEIVFRDLEVIE